MKSQEAVSGNRKPCYWYCNCFNKVCWTGGLINNRRAYSLIFGCTGLLIFTYYSQLNSNANDLNYCSSSIYFGITNDSQTASNSTATLNPEFENDNYSLVIANGDKAFFLETSGSETLSIRQSCAVESLALHNPNITAYVLFANEQINSSSITLQTLMGNYKNIRIIGLNMDNYLADSPLEHWYKFTDWRKGPYHVAHFSDGLRLHTVSKYGGYYFDLDIIHVRPVTYYRNFIGTEDGGTASNGAIHADFGCPVMQMAVHDFPANYRADAWTHNGPDLLGRVLNKWCGVKSLSEMSYLKCRGFSVLPKPSFYPVYYGNWQEYFTQRNPANETLNEDLKFPDWLTTEVIGVHVWNKLSYAEPVYRNSSQFYTQLARTHCPFTFSMATDVF